MVRFADRTLAPVRDDNGVVVLIVASGLDITEQKRDSWTSWSNAFTPARRN